MVEDVSSAVDVSPGRLHVYKVETSKNSIRAHMVIYPSLAAGSGIPSIEPRDSRDITLDLIAQVRIQLLFCSRLFLLARCYKALSCQQNFAVIAPHIVVRGVFFRVPIQKAGYAPPTQLSWKCALKGRPSLTQRLCQKTRKEATRCSCAISFQNFRP